MTIFIKSIDENQQVQGLGYFNQNGMITIIRSQHPVFGEQFDIKRHEVPEIVQDAVLVDGLTFTEIEHPEYSDILISQFDWDNTNPHFNGDGLNS